MSVNYKSQHTRRPSATFHVNLNKGALPNPSGLAALLAPKLAPGDKIEFAHRPKAFVDWSWLLEVDAAFHEHGAPRWAEAVVTPLYRGPMYLEAGCWIEHHDAVSRIVTGEVMVVFGDDGKPRRWADCDGYILFAGTCANPDRWEPGFRYRGVEYISWRDARLGLQLAELVLEEIEAEAELAAVIAEAEAEAELLPGGE
jgi:hypothetical protein